MLFMYKLPEEEYNNLTIPTTMKSGTVVIDRTCEKPIRVLTHDIQIYKEGEEPDIFNRCNPDCNNAITAILLADGNWVNLKPDIRDLELCDPERLVYKAGDKVQNALIDAIHAASEFYYKCNNTRAITVSDEEKIRNTSLAYRLALLSK